MNATSRRTATQLSERSGAVRMRRLRERRQRGFRVVHVEYCAADAVALVRAGLLDRIERDNEEAVEAAVGRLLEQLADRYAQSA